MPINDVKKRREYQRNRYKETKSTTIKTDKTNKKYFPIYLSEWVIAAANRIAQEGILKGTYKWRTTAEVIRAMIEIGINRLKDEGDEILAEFAPRIELESHFAELGRDRRQAYKILQDTRREISELEKISATEGALLYYMDILESVAKLPKSTWTDWLNHELRITFPEFQKKIDAGEIPEVNPLRNRRKWQRDVEDKREMARSIRRGGVSLRRKHRVRE